MEKRKKKNGRSSKPSPEAGASGGSKLPQPLEKQEKAGPPAYLRYSGLAFEMVATIGLATYGGYLLDDYMGLKFPVFLLSFAMLSLAGSMYLLIKRLPKD